MATLSVGQLYDRAVQHGGDRVAITHAERHVGYRELGDTAARLMTGLAALGLGKGDRIAFLMANRAEYVACEYAIAKLGATRVPLAVLLARDDHVYMMNFARCKALTTTRSWPSAWRACSRGPQETLNNFYNQSKGQRVRVQKTIQTYLPFLCVRQ